MFTHKHHSVQVQTHWQGGSFLGGVISWGSHDSWNHKRGPSWVRPCIPAHTGMITEPLISHMTLMQLPESAVGQKSRHGWLQIQIWKEPQQQTWPFKSRWIHKRCLKPEPLQMSRKYSCRSSCWQHWWQFLLQSAASHTLMSDLLWSWTWSIIQVVMCQNVNVCDWFITNSVSYRVHDGTSLPFKHLRGNNSDSLPGGPGPRMIQGP